MGELVDLADYRPDCEAKQETTPVWILPELDSKGRQRLYLESLCDHCLREHLAKLGISGLPIEANDDTILHFAEADIGATLTKYRCEIPVDRNTRRSLKSLLNCMARASR